MRLIVLGASAAYAGPDEACSGYLISHLHPDHFLDIYPLHNYYLLNSTIPDFSLRVLAPSKASELLDCILSDDYRKKFINIFRFEDINGKIEYRFGNLKLQFCKVNHLEPTYAVAIIGKKKLVYSSDTGYCEDLVEFARGADVFICEATLKEVHAGAPVNHLTAKQAAIIAKKAEVKKLFLTHMWPGYDREVSLKEAKEVFDGEIIMSGENKAYEI
ncbi:MBL fold metallo-hydrolase [Candidatus Oleimmundimicrobium sp.]|uniref:MBL fold metallo-hydrolase n=1 Tax=Candidatus Oleimmundimicrobium sp. TaxID=3060597 RepID=UPI002727FCCF|nr:MBL fold metallo-hydrolase [Candidatus Oleimmundimicrobium sp.]MDO8885871.1 MBL fold metallo-hydrolase [Candidatus Oleimmundimicrobium sp.]